MSAPAAAWSIPWRRLRRSRGLVRGRTLPLLVAAHLLLGLGYGLAAPPFEAPDEPGHYLYVRHLQVHRRLPVQGAEFYAPRAHHPPGYYVLGALLTAWVADDTPPVGLDLPLNPHFGFRAGDRASFDNRAAYLHHGPGERFPYQGRSLTLHLLRLLSLAFSIVGVVFTYRAAELLRPAQPAFGWLAAGLVAFNPIVLFASGLVYNDTAALGAAAMFMYALSALVRRGFTLRRWLGAGALLGLGLLLKSSLLVLALPAAALLLGQAWRARAWRAAVLGAVAFGGPPVLLAGWWHARSARLYGDWTANAAIGLLNGLVPPDERWPRLAGNVAWLLQSLFGCGPLGPASLCFPAPFFAGAGLLTLLALAGLALSVARRRAAAGPDQSPTAALWALHGGLLLALGASAVVYALTYRNTWQGRLWLPAFPSLAMLLAAGLLAWLPSSRRSVAAAGLVVLAATVGAYGLWGLIIPAYGPPRAPRPLELAAAHPLDAQLGNAAQAVAYRLSGRAISGGQTLEVMVYWRPVARTTVPLTVFVHLYSDAHGSLAQRDTYPGLGNYPTIFWDPGRAFVDTYRLYLPAALPTGQARILLGLYDGATGQRLPVTGADASPANAWVAFGEIEVR